jgi:tetratricopeptide (TPR) repeat protein
LYESAFKANPEDLLCVQSLGDVLMRQQLWNRAIDHFRKALDYFPNEPYILERIGTLLVACPDISMRNYIEGREYLERVFIHKACPDEIMIAAGRSLAEASAALGDKQKAALYMRFVMELAISNYAPKEFLDDLGKKLQEYNQ